ncbi:MAG: PKD domain-containing protein [Saprospiraceae bacterium]
MFPQVGFAPLTVTMDGSQSYSPNGGNLRYFWDFGDGQPIIEGGSTISHTYFEGGCIYPKPDGDQ